MKLKSLLLSFLVVCCVSVSQAQTTFIPYGDVWKYLVTATDPGATWTQTSYSDASWSADSAQLGYGDGDEKTVIGYGPDSTHKYRTTYFRKTVSITDPTSYSNVLGNIKRDDGAIVYINGTEVFRTNLPTGTITYSTLASNATDDGNTPQGFSFSPSLLVSGNNTIAVEVHQVIDASSDLSFDLELTGVTNAVFLGNVGIGTSTPATRLHIVDNFHQGYGYYKPVMAYNPNLANGEHVQLAFGRENSSYNQAELNFNQDGGVGSANNTFSLGLSGKPTILTVRGTGNVGIGTTTPESRLTVKNSEPSSSGGIIELGNFEMTVNPTANYTARGSRRSLQGYATIPSSNTFSIDRVYGTVGSAENYGSGSIGSLVGTQGWAYTTQNSASIAGIRGAEFMSESDKGTIGELTGAYIWSGVYGGTVTSQYGINIDNLDIWASTVTNRYGLYMSAFTGTATNDYGIYQAGTVQKNYFAGNVGIGTAAPGPYKLAVEGTVGVRKLKVTQVTPWADYVFDPSYKLPSLSEVEDFIRQHKHLPDVPSAGEVEKNGLDVGDNQAVLLKKIEELTLYMIDMKKALQQQAQEIVELKRKVKAQGHSKSR